MRSTKSAVLTLAVSLIAASAPDARAQAGLPFPKGGPATTPKKSNLDRYDGDGTGGTSTGTPRKEEARIALGDRVQGSLRLGFSHVVSFAGVRGAKLTLALKSGSKRVPLVADLLDPSGARIAAAASKPGDPGAYELSGFELPQTGTYLLRLDVAADPVGTYQLATSIEFPKDADQALDLTAGKPTTIEFGGIEGRKLGDVVLQAADGTEHKWKATLQDPDGVPVDLAKFIDGGLDAGTLRLADVPIERNGNYRLTIADLGRSSTRGSLKLGFENPAPGKLKHALN